MCSSDLINLTAVDPCRRGQVTAYSCVGRVDVPTVSFEGGRTTGGMAIVPLAAGLVGKPEHTGPQQTVSAALAEVARTTGGQALRAETAQELSKIYENLGLCALGEGGKLIDERQRV